MAQVSITINIPDNDIAAATAVFGDVAGLKTFVGAAVKREILEKQREDARDAAESGVSEMDITAE